MYIPVDWLLFALFSAILAGLCHFERARQRSACKKHPTFRLVEFLPEKSGQFGPRHEIQFIRELKMPRR